MTFYFYDLETSGVNPREQRVMQFAGQRTNEKFEPIGDVDNVLIKLTEEILPDPWAILTHKITPQKCQAEGLTEKEFLDWFNDTVTTPNTIITGYNSIRFDDEFMRYMHYRNFYDPYEWQWRDGRSKWDLLDVVRMMRALRPEGIQWPYSSEGKPSARLEDMTKVNEIDHIDAHTADSDVAATISLAKLLHEKQPRMFDYLLSMRDKHAVSKLVSGGTPFLYTSGRYASEHLKTTAVVSLGDHPEQAGTVIVYDLRYDPDELKNLDATEMAARIFPTKESGLERLPAKTLATNKCPAVAPLGVLDASTEKRIALDVGTIKKNLSKLQASGIPPKILDAFSQQHAKRQASFVVDAYDVDTMLYDGFFNDADKTLMSTVRSANEDDISNLVPAFHDNRLEKLLPLYKARNFPRALDNAQRETWQAFVRARLFSGHPSRIEIFARQLEQALTKIAANSEDAYLLSELQLYVQANVPDAS